MLVVLSRLVTTGVGCGLGVAVGVSVGTTVEVGVEDGGLCSEACWLSRVGVDKALLRSIELFPAGGSSDRAPLGSDVSICPASAESPSLLTMKKLRRMALPRISSRYGRTKAGRLRRTVVRVFFRGAGRLRRSLIYKRVVRKTGRTASASP